MRWVTALLWRVRALVTRGRVERELDAELRFHLDQQIEEYVAAGLSPDAARTAAMRALGSVTRVKEGCRESLGVRLLDDVRQDLRGVVRLARRAPGFTLGLILTFALGIGATTAAFSLVDGVLLRPWPYRDADRLVVVHEILPQATPPTVPVNALHYREWRSAARSFEDMALLFAVDVSVTGLGTPEHVAAARVSPRLFAMLGVNPPLGRPFLEEEDQAGRDRVVLLSHDWWTRRFAADAGVIGRVIALDGEPHTIVGVLPATFRVPKLRHLSARPSVAEEPHLYTPFALWDAPNLFGWFGFTCVAKLRPGVTLERASAELNGIQRGVARAFTARTMQETQFQAAVVPLHTQIVAGARDGVGLVLLAGVLILLVACTTVAHLLFAMGRARQREVAVRLAVGAGRGRLIRQLMLESLLLSTVGGLVGVAVASGAVRVMRLVTVIDVPRLEQVALNGRVLLAALVVTMSAGVVSSLAPAWSLVRSQAPSAPRTGWTPLADTHAGRLRWGLMAMQLGVSTVCVVVASLLAHSFVNILGVDRGFTEREVLTVPLNVTQSRYREVAPRIALADRLLARVRQLPGVTGVGLASRLPLQGQVSGSVLSVEGVTVPVLERPMVPIQATDPTYFATMGIPVRAGRVFDETDRDRRMVAVVAASVAERAWPGQTAVGRRFRFGQGDSPLLEVIGVVGDVHGVSLTEGPTLDVYLPYWQSNMAIYGNRLALVVKAAPRVSGLAPALQSAIAEIDPELPMPAVRSVEALADASVASRRLTMRLALGLAVTALLLAGLGLFGVVSFAVARRTHEIGVRMALGASARAVRWLVLRESVWPVVGGLVAGLTVSTLVSGLLRSALFGISPTEPRTLAAAVAVLAVVAAAAIDMPARRATRVNPLLVLRRE